MNKLWNLTRCFILGFSGQKHFQETNHRRDDNSRYLFSVYEENFTVIGREERKMAEESHSLNPHRLAVEIWL